MSGGPACRFCGERLSHSLVDLGMAPAANAFLSAGQLSSMELFFPLKAWVCGKCFLVQVEAFQTPDAIFGDYAYFSSYSTSWLAHAKAFAEAARQRFGLTGRSLVVELASNDGYLLQYFKAAGIPVLGIEPAANVAEVATAAGIPTLVKFFGTATANQMVQAGQRADLLIGINVLAHVPDLNDFVAGMALVLGPDGVVSVEFPHLLELLRFNQFDTIYNEHFCYFSLLTAQTVFRRHGLAIFDVERLTTHGGSLRILARHADHPEAVPSQRLLTLEQEERKAGLDRFSGYGGFEERVRETKRRLLEFLIAAKREGKRIVGYGAAAKGNTLLNYCGIRGDFLDYTVDRSPHKQGHYLPGTHIPIFGPEKIAETRPDYVLILPWNLKDEIMEQMAHVREWGGRFVVPIPEVRVL